ncbi:hypothetical protein ACVXZ4_01070 [Lacisediminihabitans sp. FW035]
MTRTSICAYPWDLIGDAAAGDRLAAVGADSVVLAAAYHSVRAATPLHPGHRVVDATHSALYVPVRADAWSGTRLVPRAAGAWAGPDSFSRAAETATAAGVAVEAWIVLTHNGALGRENPELCVRNAFGDVYDYALCPSNGDVVDYSERLVSEVVEQSAVSSLVIEACGPLGSGHLGHHEKTTGADWTPVDDALLSVCFCGACVNGMIERGLDPAYLAERTRRAVGRTGSLEQTFEDATGEVLAVRGSATARLKSTVRSAARSRGIRRITFHAQPDPWAVGPGAAVMDGSADDAYLLPESNLLGADAAELERIRTLAGTAALGAYVSAMPPIDSGVLPERWSQLAGVVDELCAYHFGLLSAERLDAVARSLRAASAS